MSPAGAPARRQLLLVAGSGRSGTSLAAGLLGRLGFHIPSPEVTADASNPRGFGEPRWAVDFHTRLLHQLAIAPEDGRPEAWDLARTAAELTQPRARLSGWLTGELAQSDRVVVKDPRLTWFVGLWHAVARELDCEVAVLTMLRHPAEAVRSRQLAYGASASATTRTASWLNMMLGLEAEVRALPRALVAYDDLLADWHTTMAGAEQRLGWPLVSDRPQRALDHADGLVDTSLRHAAVGWADLGLAEPVRELADRAHEALRSLKDGTTEEQDGRLDAVRQDYAAMYAWAADLTRSRVRAARVEERRKTRVSGERPKP